MVAMMTLVTMMISDNDTRVCEGSGGTEETGDDAGYGCISGRATEETRGEGSQGGGGRGKHLCPLTVH